MTPADTWKQLFETAEKSSDPEQGVIADELQKTETRFTPSRTPAHLEVLRLLKDNEPNSITIVAIGPLTNLALAAAEDPETFLRAKEIVVMGGNIDEAGNVRLPSHPESQRTTNIKEPPFRLIKQASGRLRDMLNLRNQITPTAEFNTFADSVAAARVYALSSPKPHTTMPPVPPAPTGQKDGLPPPPFLAPYPPNLSRRLKVTLFPLDITNKHLLTRGEFKTVIEPQLAAKSPLAEWMSAFMNSTFKKVEEFHPEVTGDAVGLQLHDPLCVWYCMADSDPKWKIAEAEDIRVETSGQWTRGACVVDRRGRRKKEEDDEHEVPGDRDGWLSGGSGNRLSRCVESPGKDIFGKYLLKRLFET